MFWRCRGIPHYAVLAMTVIDPWSCRDNSTKIRWRVVMNRNVITYANHYALLTSSSPWTRSCVVLPPSQTNHLTATRCAPFAFTWRIFTTVPGSFGIPSVFTMSPTFKMGFPHASRFLIVGSTSACNSWSLVFAPKPDPQTPSKRGASHSHRLSCVRCWEACKTHRSL